MHDFLKLCACSMGLCFDLNLIYCLFFSLLLPTLYMYCLVRPAQMKILGPPLIRSCDRSFDSNAGLDSFITSLRTKVEIFRAAFGSAYKNNKETCSSS